MPPQPTETPPDDSYLAYDFQPWWQTRTARRFLVLLTGLLLVLAAGSLPAWRAIRKARSQRHAAEGSRLLAQGQLADAYDRARLGLELNPDHPDLLRLVARILAASGGADGLEAWQHVLSQPWATPEDHHAYAELALTLDQPQLVRPELEFLLAVSNPPPETLYLAARFRLRLNDLTGAIDLTRELVRREQSNPTHLLALASFLEVRSEPGAADEARQILLQLARQDASGRFDALDRLINRPAASRSDQEEAARILEPLVATHPAPVRPRVLLADARMRLDPARARVLAVETLDTLRIGTAESDDEDLLDTSRWLFRHQLFDLALVLLTPNRVGSSLTLFRARITALLGGGQTASAYRETLRDLPDFDRLELGLDRVRLARMVGDDDAARVHQEDLIRTAGRDPVRLRRVAEFANTNGLPQLAIDAWKRLVNDRLEAARATRALTELTDASGDTWAARDYARKLAELEPGNALLRLQIAHYDLLLREDHARALSVAENLLDRPEFRVHARIVAAYACLLLDERERARNYMQHVDVPGPSLPVHLRALYAALLGAFSRDAEARALAHSLTPAGLRPEERELLRPYLTPTP